VHYLRVQQIAEKKIKFKRFENNNKKNIRYTCETSSSIAVGGSLPLFTILVPVLIVDKKSFRQTI